MYIYIYVIYVALDFRETTNDAFPMFFFKIPSEKLLQPLLDVATPPRQPSPMHAVHPGHVAESAVVPGGSAEVAVLGGGCDSGWKQDGNIWEYMGICIYICTVYIYIYP